MNNTNRLNVDYVITYHNGVKLITAFVKETGYKLGVFPDVNTMRDRIKIRYNHLIVSFRRLYENR